MVQGLGSMACGLLVTVGVSHSANLAGCVWILKYVFVDVFLFSGRLPSESEVRHVHLWVVLLHTSSDLCWLIALGLAQRGSLKIKNQPMVLMVFFSNEGSLSPASSNMQHHIASEKRDSSLHRVSFQVPV